MSNNQRRTAYQQRKKRYPGPHDGTSSYELPSFQLGKRIMSLSIMRQVSMLGDRREENARLPIPRSGPGRRRAKAHRNRGLCSHPGGGNGRCSQPVTHGEFCDEHQEMVEVEVELTSA